MSNFRPKSTKQPTIDLFFNKRETRESQAGSGSFSIQAGESSKTSDSPSRSASINKQSWKVNRLRTRQPHTSPRYPRKMGVIFGKPDDETDYMMKFMRERGAKDIENYRKSYPGKVDDPNLKDNYLFYTNQLESKPDGGYIDDILEKWKGDYERLEMHHGYIQWLFPIREHGMNWHSQQLQLHEAKDIQADEKAMNRFLQSYQLMLDFYGLKLKDTETGDVSRSDNWQSRFKHLNSSMHNYLRITRILKCLGELGLEHYKYPLVYFLIEEAGFHKTLHNTLDSCITYWIETVKDEKDREKLRLRAKRYTKTAYR